MSVDPNRAKSIFLSAVEDHTPEQWSAYLDEACRGDAEVRRRVEALLAAHRGKDRLLDDPDAVRIGAIGSTEPTEGPGTVIGRFKLLEKIGEGGMAVVYMAEQQEPIRRKVALKIIKLGMDTRQVIARFEAERQALALMDHPSIAKVLDAGATETGRPYFVMELVQGVSITQYCDKNNLSTKERLVLFLQVCNAVQHAHQKGIIHRDIKPSNVMVTHHDGKPVPKVIDFGIAKATNQKLTEKTLFTRYAHIIGTPAYMSPEQAELSDLDIDTRTDIYSLGVLLYQLLTGTTPFSEEELRKASYIEMQRIIREQEPARPSTRLATLGDTLTDIAKCRDSTPDLLWKAIRGDLDWIVMKSLEKDRVRRYETASGLAEDIRRHLESEPVLARGPGTAYRLGKFLRRHRSQVLAALIMAVLAGAAVVVLSLWNRDRLRLVEAEGFRHKAILSQAQGQYARADRKAAVETVKSILDSRHVGPEAQLLYAGILVDDRQSDKAAAMLGNLLNDRPEIAGAAHSLLARILWESQSPYVEKLKQVEEHRRKAEALLPETAEAYFLRAMTALTVKGQLASLDRALELEGGHYESRRLRAFTCYASRKYDRMKEDALGMTILRPRDPLGHSLRAVALRELGKYAEAITEYDKAIALTSKDDPQSIDLSTQRCETLLRMGEHERVIADAQACLSWAGAKNAPAFQYRIFCALTALGEYEKATDLFRQIISPGYDARSKFQNWCMKYVFDTLEAGRSWHPAGREPVGPAFLPMVEAEETYRDLSAKGRRVVTDCFTGSWSPDGTKLAFSLGYVGNSGVAIFDPATKETDLLIVPGKDPRWSPDGKYIAFVRDCEVLPLPELAVAARQVQSRPMVNEEVWIIRPDGTEPRRLAYGGWPSWSRDSNRLYYQSRIDKMFCSIPVEGTDAQPTAILPCAHSFPAISPDGKCVAYLERSSLKVKDLASQKVVAQWPTPLMMSGMPAWSPSGSELCLGSAYQPNVRVGLWMHPVDGGEPAKVVSGQTTVVSWAWDQTKLLVTLGPPYNEIWTTPLDPKVSAVEALGPGRTLREHYSEMAAMYTRRIKADPMDADAYLQRAQQHYFLQEEAKVRADMRRYTAIMTQGRSLDVPSGMPWNIEHAIEGPLGYQVVLSVEQGENGLQVLHAASGQKGRGTMKSFEIPLAIMSLIGSCLFASLDAPPAYADFTFGEPARVTSGLSGDDAVDCLSYDGLEMYFWSTRAGGQGSYDLWVLKRASKDEEWGTAENLGPAVNSTGNDALASISADGLTLYFSSDRPYNDDTRYDIYMTTRATKNDPWGPAVKMGPAINGSGGINFGAWISPDNLELYVRSNRSGGYSAQDIYVARRANESDPWSEAVNLGPVVNTKNAEALCSLSPDGLLLLFSGGFGTTGTRAGSYGLSDLWMARRASLSDPWQAPVNLGPVVNGPANDCQPRVSPDGRTLYFMSQRNGRWEAWQAPIIPNYDVNSDGKVDQKDIQVLKDHWGQDYPSCDVGPFPWGDGMVNMEDLKVLVKAVDGTDLVASPAPHAVEVPRDVILSWTSPRFATTHDVYFGTSSEAVKTAGRSNPLDVLVSQGQTATTYDPEGFLAYGQTCYWRIDEVGAAPDSTIFTGSVMEFTTEAFAQPIRNITATASSFLPGMGPEKTVDGSGLDKRGGHSTESKDMWWSSTVQPHWIQFAFDKTYKLHELRVWNSNQAVEPWAGFGARNVKIEYSADGTTWTQFGEVAEFARGPGMAGYAANTAISLGGILAKGVKFTVESTWGGLPQVCLSEVQFLQILARPSDPVPASGRTGLSLDTVLTWKPGREAASHQVYFGADQEAVANGMASVRTVSEASFDPGPLTLGRTYYWKVNEVNEAQTPSAWQGGLWSFSTREYVVVDDFESYTNESPNRLFQTWIDGTGFSEDTFFPKGNPGNGTCSMIGYDPTVGSIMETSAVHGGQQAMPVEYNNVHSPFYAEVERTFKSPQDWTVTGADTLTLCFRGNPLDFLQRADGSIQMSGCGGDIWDMSDEFRFASKRLRGDGSIIAKVRSLVFTHPWAKAGVMIRASLDAPSTYAFMLPTPDGRRAFQDRTTFGGLATSAHSNPGAVTFPLWVKVERIGHNFTGYYSRDGKNWVKQPDNEISNTTNPVQIMMVGDVYIGLAVTSHNVSLPTVAEFSDVSFTGEVTGEWQVSAIGVAQPSNDAAPLYVTVEDNAGHVKSLTHPDPQAVRAIDWQEWMIPLTDFQGVNLTAVKKMVIGVGDRDNPTAGGHGVIYIDDIGFGHPLASR